MQIIIWLRVLRPAERVIRMGEDPEMVFVTGCPSIDIAKIAKNDPGE